MNHIGTKNLETERIILRKIGVKDAQLMYDNWASDNDVSKYVTWCTHKDVNETSELLKNWESEYTKLNCYRWCIVSKENDEPIGTIDVCKSNDNLEMAEIGYCMSKRYWNKGIMTECANRIIQFLFEEVGYKRIQATHALENPASGRVMQKIGMKYEGIIRDGNRLNNGNLCDVAMYSILAREYFKEEK